MSFDINIRISTHENKVMKNCEIQVIKCRLNIYFNAENVDIIFLEKKGRRKIDSVNYV